MQRIHAVFFHQGAPAVGEAGLRTDQNLQALRAAAACQPARPARPIATKFHFDMDCSQVDGDGPQSPATIAAESTASEPP